MIMMGTGQSSVSVLQTTLLAAFSVSIQSCADGVESGDTEVSETGSALAAAPEPILLGRVPPRDGGAFPTEMPYDYSGRELPEAIELRELAIRALSFETDETAYVIGVDLENGDVTAYPVSRKAQYASDQTRTTPAGREDWAAPDEEEIVEKGLSHNTDNRSYARDWSESHGVLRRVGPIVNSLGGCTGAVFSRQLVFTGAHCALSASGLAPSTTMAPRYIVESDGSATTPYGVATSTYAWFPPAFLTNSCHITLTAACVKYDWAVFHFPAGSFSSWMGVASASDSTTVGWDIDNAGYPGCNTSYAVPANCPEPAYPLGTSQGNAHVDSGCGSVTPDVQQGSTSNSWPYSDGQDPLLITGCDTGPGHSGSPMFSYSPGGSGPYIVGNYVWNWCWGTGCTATTGLASSGVRITGTLKDYLIDLKSMYHSP